MEELSPQLKQAAQSSGTLLVRDIMTKNVLSVSAEDSLELVAQLFEKYDYDGIPVIGSDRKLLGIITAYEMILESTGVHLPTVLNLMGQMAVNEGDKRAIEEHFSKIRDIKAKQIMNAKPLTLGPNTTLEDAGKFFAEHHRVNPVPITDENGILVGVVSRYDIIKFFNQKYFNQVVANATIPKDPFKEFAPTKTEREVESAVGDLSKEFLLVTKRRPRMWKYAFFGALAAGFLAATALIIRIVQRGG